MSFTAYHIILVLAKMARMPFWQGFFPEGLKEDALFFASNGKRGALLNFIRLVPLKAHLRLIDMLFVPGMGQHFLMRKALIGSEVKKAIAGGCRQVVILGAGFDTLGIRLALQHKQVQCFEMDLPATQSNKKQLLEKKYETLPNNFHMMPCDLIKDSLPQTLQTQPSHDARADTFFIIEGVLMYLSEAEVQKVFKDIATLPNASVSVLFGAMAKPDTTGSVLLRAVSGILGKAGEATKWACLSADMPSFTTKCGLTLEKWASYKELQKPIRNQEELKKIPDEDENFYLAVRSSAAIPKKEISQVQGFSGTFLQQGVR
jgi:methyltransferase (TIGR00027 family)